MNFLVSTRGCGATFSLWEFNNSWQFKCSCECSGLALCHTRPLSMPFVHHVEVQRRCHWFVLPLDLMMFDGQEKCLLCCIWALVVWVHWHLSLQSPAHQHKLRPLARVVLSHLWCPLIFCGVLVCTFYKEHLLTLSDVFWSSLLYAFDGDGDFYWRGALWWDRAL